MIIWGTYVMRRVAQKGEFHCPHCAGQRPYKLRQPRKWGHLYWIPLIPMRQFDRYVECTACKGEFVEATLAHDPVREEREFVEAVTLAVGSAMSHLGNLTAHLPLAADIVARAAPLVGREPPADTVTMAIGKDARGYMVGYAAAAGALLSAAGRETVLRAILGEDGLTEATREDATELGLALGLSPAHVAGILAELAGQSSGATQVGA